MQERGTSPGRSLRFDWEGGPSRVQIDLDEQAPAKTLVSVEHERLPDPARAEIIKTMWKERLTQLHSVLES